MGKLLNTKIFALALLALVLVFAVSQIEWKVQERRATRDGVVQGIADQYAREQQLVGPLLWVKCHEPQVIVESDQHGSRRRTVEADCSRLIRPDSVIGKGTLDVSERSRGLYRANIYSAALALQAVIPAFQAKPGHTLESAALVFGVSDPRGIKTVQVSTADGRELETRPGSPAGDLRSGFHVPIGPAELARPMHLNVRLDVGGSGRFDWVPIASSNDIELQSAWPHPSFDGRFLPEQREIGGSGFKARWLVSDFATGGDTMLSRRSGTVFGDSFGVSLIDPVDAYTQTDRAVRYGFLFVLLTLGGFFLFEMIKKKPVHPLQYLLIGFAVVLFFLLLLALSEHIAFLSAYLVAAAACAALIAVYGRTLVGSWTGATVLGGGYSLLYAGLYMLLASEDYALLMGAWLIFGLLALTMWLTRRLDWNASGQTEAEA